MNYYDGLGFSCGLNGLTQLGVNLSDLFAHTAMILLLMLSN